MFCKFCGNTLEPTDKICGKCGNAVAPVSATKICPVCVTEVKAESIFCTNCGAKLESENAPTLCPSCSAEVKPGNSFCTSCGAKLTNNNISNKCHSCGTPLKEGALFCHTCGAKAGFAPTAPAENLSPKSRLVAGLLGIFLGYVGVHSFYLGKIGVGVAQVLATVFTCGLGSLWGLIDGIVILAKKDVRDGEGRLLAE